MAQPLEALLGKEMAAATAECLAVALAVDVVGAVDLVAVSRLSEVAPTTARAASCRLHRHNACGTVCIHQSPLQGWGRRMHW